MPLTIPHGNPPIRHLAVLHLLLIGVGALALVVAGTHRPVGVEPADTYWRISILMAVSVLGLHLVVVLGYLRAASWARAGLVAFSVLYLFSPPAGTVLGAYTLYRLVRRV